MSNADNQNPQIRTRIFFSNKSQAVRLPKEVRFGEDVTDVVITVVGNSRIITPAASLRGFFANPDNRFDDSFHRGEQVPSSDREAF